MAVTSPTTPAAPAPAVPSPPLPVAKRRELARADVNDQLTKLLQHGYGTLTVKVHDHRVAAMECTTRMLEGRAEEGSF